MKRIDDYVKNQKYEKEVQLILQVHDELVYEIKDSLIDEVVWELKNLMETTLPKEKTFGVPIIVEVQTGDNWGEMTSLPAQTGLKT